MDSTTRSAAQLARELGTSTPRVTRTARRLGLGLRPGEDRAGGRLHLTPGDERRLRDELGASASAPGLTPTQLRVLAVASRAPLGISSAREIARRAALSPTAAARAVAVLEARELLVRAVGLVGQPRLLMNWEHRDARLLRPALARVVVPKRAPRDRQVPRRLRHLFWNTARSQLDVQQAGPYIATRLLRTMDPEALGWGARTLAPEDWTAGARVRGLSPAARALAENLAGVER